MPTPRERLAPYILQTPLVRAFALSERLGREVYLKLETLQPTGSFKVRAAFNGILTQLEKARAHGVVTSSSGNFAQAVAYAAKKLGAKATIVMMKKTSPLKVDRTRALGAEIVFCENTFESRWATTAELLQKTGAASVHPFDSEATIAGGATLGEELLEQVAGPFLTLVPTSGGGLLAGVSRAIKEAKRSGARVFGVQPANGGSMARSLEAGKPVRIPDFPTLADALIAVQPGELPFNEVKKHADGVLTVSEDVIREATRFLADEQKLLVEPGGAVGVAALLMDLVGYPELPVVCVLSGGNFDPRHLMSS